MPPPVVALLIPILLILAGIVIGALIFVLDYRRRKETFALYHQERMAALDKGVELPPLPEGLFANGSSSHHPRRHLLRGLTWLFTGIGLGVALWKVADEDVALFSLIPIGVGLARLIYYFTEGKKEAKELAAASAAAKL
jgi:hypothetical protein